MTCAGKSKDCDLRECKSGECKSERVIEIVRSKYIIENKSKKIDGISFKSD